MGTGTALVHTLPALVAFLLTLVGIVAVTLAMHRVLLWLLERPDKQQRQAAKQDDLFWEIVHYGMTHETDPRDPGEAGASGARPRPGRRRH